MMQLDDNTITIQLDSNYTHLLFSLRGFFYCRAAFTSSNDTNHKTKQFLLMLFKSSRNKNDLTMKRLDLYLLEL